MKHLHVLCGLAFLMLAGFTTQGQNLENIGLKKGVKVTGGIGFNQTLYTANGVENRFYPYLARVSGNVNIAAGGFNIPITFAYSNQQFTYSQPFNIVGASPTYKGLTLHAGYRNLNFSKYSLAGHNFLGGGAEYKKGGWEFGLMGGRLMKAVEYDSLQNSFPVYERRGYGLKVGYSKGGDGFVFTSFYAKDEENSIQAFPVSEGVRPMENQVYTLKLNKQLNKNVGIYIEGARSGVTYDTRDSSSSPEITGIDKTLFFLPVKASTEFSYALNAGINIKTGKTNWGFTFERVEGNYNSLGAYYMNNDFQNVRLNLSRPFWNKKLNLSGSVGLQKDDLKNQKQSNSRRVVGSVSATANVSKRVNFNLSYSGFNNYINVKPFEAAFIPPSDAQLADTLNYRQVNHTFNGGVNFIPLDNSNIRHMLNLNANYNLSNNEQGSTTEKVDLLGSMVGYSMNFKAIRYNLGFNLSYNRNNMSLGTSEYAGGGVTNSIMAFKKKVRVSLNFSVNQNFENGVKTALLYNAVHSYVFRVGKKHSFNVNMHYTHREAMAQAELSQYDSTFDEFRASLGYSFRF